MNIARAYRVMRFFETIQGFHKVSVMLSHAQQLVLVF